MQSRLGYNTITFLSIALIVRSTLQTGSCFHLSIEFKRHYDS